MKGRLLFLPSPSLSLTLDHIQRSQYDWETTAVDTAAHCAADGGGECERATQSIRTAAAGESCAIAAPAQAAGQVVGRVCVRLCVRVCASDAEEGGLKGQGRWSGGKVTRR